jgi:Tfp pilus assembly protein PilP
MRTRPFAFVLLLVTFLALSACTEEQAGQKPAVDVKAAAAAKAAPAAAAVAGKPQAAKKPAAGQTAQVEIDPPPALTVPQGYSYEPRGRRDPFVNPVPKPAGGETVARPLIRPDGLPGVLVSEVKLSGIIYSPQATMKKAILVVGRSTYFAGQGDSLFDGVVREIRPNEVVFSMVSTTTKQPVNRETVVRTGGSSVTLVGENK